MAILQLGLIVGALCFLYVVWASWSAGYPPEVASLRGVVAFGAVAIVAYVGELIVVTAPGGEQQAAQHAAESGAAAPATAASASAAATAASAASANIAAAAGAGRAAAPVSAGGPALVAGEQFASLPAGEPIVAPDFDAVATSSTQEAELAQLRPAA